MTQRKNNDNDWEEFIKNIEKLPQPKAPEKKKIKPREIKPQIDISSVYSGDILSDLRLGNTDNIDNNTAKKFRKNEFKVEAVLDLHGHTEDRAFEEVINFIKTSYQRKLRCVIIITGKGLHRTDENDIFSSRGILKDKVPNWLNQQEIRPFILSYNHPSPNLGGEGALYILLRRQRD